MLEIYMSRAVASLAQAGGDELAPLRCNGAPAFSRRGSNERLTTSPKQCPYLPNTAMTRGSLEARATWMTDKERCRWHQMWKARLLPLGGTE